MPETRPVHEQFSEVPVPADILDMIVLGGLPENGLHPEDEIADRLIRYFSKAPASTKSNLERTLFDWLDNLAKSPPRQSRDYFAHVLHEVLVGANELEMKELAALMAPNAEYWGEWLRRYAHGSANDPFETFCRLLAEMVGITQDLSPFWFSISKFEGHKSKACAEIACNVIIYAAIPHLANGGQSRSLVEDADCELLVDICVQHAHGLMRYYRENDCKSDWIRIWEKTFAAFSEGQAAVMQVAHRLSDVKTTKKWVEELSAKVGQHLLEEHLRKARDASPQGRPIHQQA